jgi:hypothetical protein
VAAENKKMVIAKGKQTKEKEKVRGKEREQREK